MQDVNSQYVIQNRNTKVTIDLFGGQIVSIIRNGKELLKKYNKNRTPAAVLFPIAGNPGDSLPLSSSGNKIYEFEGKEYEMSHNGFIRDLSFSLVSCDDKHVDICFQSNEETVKMYPFSFFYYAHFALVSDGSLVHEVAIRNTYGTGDSSDVKGSYPNMVMQHGFHPYYAIDGKLTDHSIRVLDMLKIPGVEPDILPGDEINIPQSLMDSGKPMMFHGMGKIKLELLKNGKPTGLVISTYGPNIWIWTNKQGDGIAIESIQSGKSKRMMPITEQLNGKDYSVLHEEKIDGAVILRPGEFFQTTYEHENAAERTYGIIIDADETAI